MGDHAVVYKLHAISPKRNIEFCMSYFNKEVGYDMFRTAKALGWEVSSWCETYKPCKLMAVM